MYPNFIPSLLDQTRSNQINPSEPKLTQVTQSETQMHQSCPNLGLKMTQMNPVNLSELYITWVNHSEPKWTQNSLNEPKEPKWTQVNPSKPEWTKWT